MQKIFLSGTPIENSIDELWAQFMVLIPELKNMYSHVRSLDISSSEEEYVRLSAKLLKPFILRRTKSEVMLELPDKTEEVIYVELSPAERQIYANLHSIISRALSTGLTGRINSLVLEGLLRLRQACVSVNMLPVSLRRDREVESSKLELVRSYIKQAQSSNKKIIVFSQFVRALKELETLLKEDKVEYSALYGETHNRESVISLFKKKKEIPVMLMSLKAGGVGLNLTEADSVILLDDWWNPAVEDQAIARAHRIGQKNNVLVLSLVCKDTIEEKILQLQEKKRLTVDLFNKTSASLSITEIKELLS
jgi:SNF2 family DNA or RNA helicase